MKRKNFYKQVLGEKWVWKQGTQIFVRLTYPDVPLERKMKRSYFGKEIQACFLYFKDKAADRIGGDDADIPSISAMNSLDSPMTPCPSGKIVHVLSFLVISLWNIIFISCRICYTGVRQKLSRCVEICGANSLWRLFYSNCRSS